MIVLLLLMNWSESQAQEPRWYPAGMEIIPDGRVEQMEAKKSVVNNMQTDPPRRAAALCSQVTNTMQLFLHRRRKHPKRVEFGAKTLQPSTDGCWGRMCPEGTLQLLGEAPVLLPAKGCSHSLGEAPRCGTWTKRCYLDSQKSHIANNHGLWFAVGHGQRLECCPPAAPPLGSMQPMVPGYYRLADMDPITCSLSVQQQSEQGTVLTKPGDSRDLAQTAKGDHKAATQFNVSWYQLPSLRYNSRSRACWGPACTSVPSHTSLPLLCLLRCDAAHCGLGNYLTTPFMGSITKSWYI